ncbi:MAG: hypothetical protein QOF51_2446 [Chloroflexota bacterium]|nr:hypothetical protein [Chloroflexota bacterium]
MIDTTHDTLQALAQQFVEACNAHDPDRLIALFAPDYEGAEVADPAPQQGRAAARETYARYLAAFPDMRMAAEQVLVDAPTVAIAWSIVGTHRGTLMHIPPTGRRINVRGVTLLTIQGNLIRRGSSVWDLAGLLRALGLLPNL